MAFENIKKEEAEDFARREAVRKILQKSPYYEKLPPQEAEKLIGELVNVLKKN